LDIIGACQQIEIQVAKTLGTSAFIIPHFSLFFTKYSEIGRWRLPMI
jgi:hypothetical protein